MCPCVLFKDSHVEHIWTFISWVWVTSIGPVRCCNLKKPIESLRCSISQYVKCFTTNICMFKENIPYPLSLKSEWGGNPSHFLHFFIVSNSTNWCNMFLFIKWNFKKKAKHINIILTYASIYQLPWLKTYCPMTL